MLKVNNDCRLIYKITQKFYGGGKGKEALCESEA